MPQQFRSICVMLCLFVYLQTPKGFSNPGGLRDSGDAGTGTFTEDSNLPIGSRKSAGAEETAAAQQDGFNEIPNGNVREHAGQSRQGQSCLVKKTMISEREKRLILAAFPSA